MVVQDRLHHLHHLHHLHLLLVELYLTKTDVPNFSLPTDDFNVLSNRAPSSISTKGIGNNLFGSQAATTIRENKTKTQQEVDDFLYELLDTMPDLVFGDELLNTIGTGAQNLFDKPSKKEEDEILKYIWMNMKLKILGIQWMKLPKFQKVFTFFMVETVNSL